MGKWGDDGQRGQIAVMRDEGAWRSSVQHGDCG